jgi:hypothetical protein
LVVSVVKPAGHNDASGMTHLFVGAPTNVPPDAHVGAVPFEQSQPYPSGQTGSHLQTCGSEQVFDADG